MGAALLFLIRLWYGNCLADRAVIFNKKLVFSLGSDFMSQVTGQYCRIYTFWFRVFPDWGSQERSIFKVMLWDLGARQGEHFVSSTLIVFAVLLLCKRSIELSFVAILFAFLPRLYHSLLKIFFSFPLLTFSCPAFLVGQEQVNRSGAFLDLKYG